MKSKVKRTAACLCAAVLASTAFSAVPELRPGNVLIAAAADNDLVLHYDTSAGNNHSGNAWDNDESFYKALPLGNGRIGAVADHHRHFYFRPNRLLS